jgi:hypothetical protein
MSMLLPQQAQDKNQSVIRNFLKIWRRRGALIRDAPSVCTFQCSARYRFRADDLVFSTQAYIQLSGPNSYDIQFYENGGLIAETFYTKFSPKFQMFTLTKTKSALRIKGGSTDPPEDKMGGPYVIDVIPNAVASGRSPRGGAS